jgi:putative hydrolase of the HAD superfamily
MSPKLAKQAFDYRRLAMLYDLRPCRFVDVNCGWHDTVLKLGDSGISAPTGPRHRFSPVWRAIVFDGDDTLWLTEPLYDAARQRARSVVEAAGLDGGRWEELERRRDVENVSRFGHTLERFPTSCVEAYIYLCAEIGQEVDAVLVETVGAAARTVFEQAAPLMPHARETLSALRERGLKLALLTKGDRAVQRRRIDQSGLAPLFDVIKIVDEKTPDTITGVLAELQVAPNAALSVGNSLRSDVVPSLAAGVQPIWIDAHVWEYEREAGKVQGRVIELEDLHELLKVTS